VDCHHRRPTYRGRRRRRPRRCVDCVDERSQLHPVGRVARRYRRHGNTPSRSESTNRHRGRDLLVGWRIILADKTFRLLFANTVLVNSLILAPAPLLAAVMLGPLGFAPWQYALAFALPCVGGIGGSRLAHPLVARFGQHAVLRTSDALRACWSVGLAAVSSGVPGFALVIVVQFGLVTCAGIFNPVLATCLLEHLPATHAARALSAWSTTTKACVAVLTGLWGGPAEMTGPRIAVAVAGLLLLATPLLLPRQLHRNVALTADRLVCESPPHREPVTPPQ
jgi:MFS family permease